MNPFANCFKNYIQLAFGSMTRRQR